MSRRALLVSGSCCCGAGGAGGTVWCWRPSVAREKKEEENTAEPTKKRGRAQRRALLVSGSCWCMVWCWRPSVAVRVSRSMLLFCRPSLALVVVVAVVPAARARSLFFSRVARWMSLVAVVVALAVDKPRKRRWRREAPCNGRNKPRTAPRGAVFDGAKKNCFDSNVLLIRSRSSCCVQ